MPFTVTFTAIPDVLVLEPRVFGDARGSFYESLNARDFAQVIGLQVDFEPQLAVKDAAAKTLEPIDLFA